MKKNIFPLNILQAATLAFALLTVLPVQAKDRYPSRRPPIGSRTFSSKAVEETIEETKKKIADEKLRWMFENTFPNTLDTTVKHTTKSGRPDSFIITGDINAMWLRDSSAQVWSYMSLMKNDPELKRMIAGLINRQASCILIDPYANAFNYGPEGSYWETDKTQHMAKELHERKWEIDSLCYPIRLAFYYWQITGDASIFDDLWGRAAKLIVHTFKEQQRKQGLGPYSFMRDCDRPTDSQINGGWGAPVKPVGLIVSSFRPSDDATQYGFLIPSNMFAVVSLRQLAEIETKVFKDTAFAGECLALADEVDQAIRKYGIVRHPVCGQVYAYEVDGFGNALCMDDANVPSLLSAPYLGYCSPTDSIYLNTRRLIWSDNNPYFFRGKAGEGIGGPHVGLNHIWPMSILMKALTTDDTEEIQDCIRRLRNTDAGTGFMHESFHADDAKIFTRPWFAWANSLFGELILKVSKEHPNLLQTPLSFTKGKLKLAQFTDLHWTPLSPRCAETEATIRSVLKTEAPSLAILTGDVVTDTPALKGWKDLIRIFEDTRTPFVVLMGNHDGEVYDKSEVYRLLLQSPYYVSTPEAAGISGHGNYALPVYDSETQDTVRAVLYGIDSNDYREDNRHGQYDWIHNDQIQWYREQSKRFTRANGGKPLPSLMFFHIPLLEYNSILKQETTAGNIGEGISSPDINSGMFASVVDMGDVCGIFAGHDHNNDFIGKHFGIALGFGRVTGADAYGTLPRGARIIELEEGSPRFTTWIRTPSAREFTYYYPSGITSAQEDTMAYHRSLNVSPLKQGVKYTYHEGRFKQTADIALSKPLKQGVMKNISISGAPAKDHFAYTFHTLIRIPRRGVYRFYTFSDDGSRLYIDGDLVVNNDGGHSARDAEGMIALEEGYHDLRLLYFEDYMGETLEVSYESRDIIRTILPDSIFYVPD